MGGHSAERETGLQYLGWLYYAPTPDNSLTPDPAAGITRQPYTYAGDSPLNAGGLTSRLPSLSAAPEPTPDLVHRVLAFGVRQVGDFLGETHDDLVSADPLHVCVTVVNSLTIAASVMDLGLGLAMLAS